MSDAYEKAKPGFIFETTIGPDLIRKNFHVDHRVDSMGFHSIRIQDDASAAPNWQVVFDFEENALQWVLNGFRHAVLALERYKDGDRGGPTPEMARRIAAREVADE